VGQGSREDSPGSTWGGLALISRYGVGCDGVDLEAAQEHGVLVSNTPGANSRPTAEWTLSTILDVAGGRVLQHERASQGLSKAGPSRIDIEGKIAGIIGTGAVGRRVASLLSSMGAEVVAADLIPDRTWADSMGVRYVDLEQLCRTAQIISLHASGSERLIGERELDTMKTGTILINCARFHLVDNRAAYQAVAKGHLRGYGLDESWPYPDLSLSGLNIVTSPHVGSDSDIGKAHMQLMSVQAVADFLEGRPPAQLLTSQ